MDTLEYKDLFISESLEHLDELNQALLALEKDPTSRESVHNIFRISHTLKGMAATMGFDQITDLTHQMENVLDQLRTREKPVSPKLVDLLFRCLDMLGLLIEEISSGEPKSLDVEGLRQQLADFTAEKGAAPAAGPTPEPAVTAPPAMGLNFAPAVGNTSGPTDYEHLEELVAQADAQGYTLLGVKVRLQKQCAMKGVRAFMVVKYLSEHGEIIASLPDPQALQEGNFALDFSLLLLTQRGEDLLQRGLKNISELEHVTLETLTRDDLQAFFGEQHSHAAILVEAPAASPSLASAPAARTVQSIRVSVDRLDNLQNLVGELVINKIRLSQISRQVEQKELKEALAQFDRIMDELQDEVTQVRMVPMEHIFNRFPRMVRDLAKESGKEIDLQMEGKEIELDRTVLDEINEPLVHLLRNAVDHGVEHPEMRSQHGKPRQGVVRLEALRDKNHVVIKVTDDGHGIDPAINRRVAVERGLIGPEAASQLTDQEAINLIALPGFTTATTVTEVSGRGVGVDAVRSKIESFGGTLRIVSAVGQGTTFILRMPMTLAIIQALLCRVGPEIFALPVINTVESIEYADAEIKIVQRGEVVLYRDNVLPLLRLQRVLLVPGEEKPTAEWTILVSEAGDLRVGLLVDEVLGQQEIAIKSLGPLLKGVRGFSGVTILGDGRVALVLDVSSLIG